MLNAIILSVTFLIVMLNVIMLSVGVLVHSTSIINLNWAISFSLSLSLEGIKKLHLMIIFDVEVP
jgi:hypothetical protein